MPKEKQIIQKARKGKPIRQVAAIPVRRNAEGRMEVMLVTSNTTERFIVPKGWPMKGKSGRKAAAIEAREEAGVVGVALKKPMGTYAYWKRLSNRFVKVVVTAYLLPVAEELLHWQESARRKRAWLTPADAARLIDEPELATLVGDLATDEGFPSVSADYQSRVAHRDSSSPLSRT
jgi:8-oxo-dGTP pyrophosphatase MutT (NUDIX family)